MIKLVKLLYPFIKELILDHNEQLNFYSVHFNAIRWVQVVGTILLIALLVLSDRALLRVSYRLHTADTQMEQLKNDHIIDQAHILQLQEKIDQCQPPLNSP